MAESRTSLAERLTSRRGAWIVIAAAVVIVVTLMGALGGAEAPPRGDQAPAGSEAQLVNERLSRFPESERQTVLIVASRSDRTALTDDDIAAVTALAPAVEEATGHEPGRPIISDDSLAAVLPASITEGADNTATAERIRELRSVLTGHPVAGVELQVTGGPAFGADVAAAFDGADLTLLLVTIGIVAVLLIVTYRSPVLWLIPVAVVGTADRLAGLVAAVLGTRLGLEFDAGIISVLVFGAGTNYALLLVSRYREELAATADHRAALATAWRRTAPAVVASNVTVVLALLTLALAVIPGTRGLGVTAGVGLLIALVAVLFVLPPVLAVCGRRVFWPFVPRPDDAAPRRSVWRTVADRVVHRPVIGLAAGVAVLGVMASGLAGASVGLSQLDKFRVASESATGLAVFAEHFPAGEAQPIFIVAATDRAEDVVRTAEAIPGVVRATATRVTDDGSLTRIMVTGEPAPGSPESLELVQRLRDDVHRVDAADALVGGAVAEELDGRAGNARDLQLIAPLVLAVSLIVLVGLLRSLVAPLLLLLVNLVSAAAAIGAGSWLSRLIFDRPALDLQVPLLSFLFLVALGIDYTIFLVHRIRAEAMTTGTREGTARAVAGTGGVITSAGIVLAGVFAALGVLPLVTLGQLGLIVGFGIVVDTLLVRTVVVPALFSLVGDRMWWPGRAPTGPGIRSDVSAGSDGGSGDENLVGAGREPEPR